MLNLFLIFGGLAVIFGFLVSAYCTFYKLKLEGTLTRAAVFVINGVVISMATFALAISLIWPPVM
ncbi:MAG: hypothetical protein M0021_02850 [Clostridia bacterium]|nr:hypothetical protein [Clostridia bacterium]